MRERGQGLAEYALVLVLVAVIVVLVAAVFGRDVQKFYCRAVYAVAPDAEAPGCEVLDVSCVIHGTAPGGYVNVEANVSDHAGEDDIQSVQFSVDGVPVPYVEEEYHYCLSHTNAAGCGWYRAGGGSKKISAVATDAENNTGSCTVEVTVPE